MIRIKVTVVNQSIYRSSAVLVMMEVTTRRLGYDDLVNAWMAKDYGARRVAYDARCKDPVCQTIVKAMFEGSQGCGWSFMWALHILAVDLAFDQLLADVPGNCIGAIEACIGGWETDDASSLCVRMNQGKEPTKTDRAGDPVSDARHLLPAFSKQWVRVEKTIR